MAGTRGRVDLDAADVISVRDSLRLWLMVLCFRLAVSSPST
jgi:hypothetical protein